jgi:hypothetical protein
VSSIRYQLPRADRQALVWSCAAAAETAAVALARWDERLTRVTPELAEGVRQRGHAFEAQALVALAGGLCPLEDLVLHDAGMDARSPTHAITRATAILNDRRRLARREPDEVLSPSTLRQRLGLSQPQHAEMSKRPADAPAATGGLSAPWERAYLGADDDEGLVDTDDVEIDDDADHVSDPAFAEIDALLARTRRKLDGWNDLSSEEGRKSLTLRDPGYDAAGRCERWLAVLDEGRGLPAALAAASALDGWLVLEPSERAGELGFALAATVLRQRGLALANLPTLGLGLRRGRFRWSPHQALSVRIAGLLGALTEAATFGQGELDRLFLAREVMLRKCENRRGNSKLAGLVDLFVSSPLVTVQFAAARLQVSPQAVEAMFRELGASLPREITGRKRYRAWGIL